MRKLIQFFVEKPIWGNSIIVFFILFGVFSVIQTKRSFFPELDPKKINTTIQSNLIKSLQTKNYLIHENDLYISFRGLSDRDFMSDNKKITPYAITLNRIFGNPMLFNIFPQNNFDYVFPF